MRFRLTGVTLAAICIAACVVAERRVTAAPGQDARRVLAGGPIPRDGYKTWSLFLVCNPAWATSERQQDLAKLYDSFKAFGDAIGNANLAVWFAMKGSLRTTSPELDAVRSARYCRALQLKPSHGPFLVITDSYPDEAAMPHDRAVYALGELSPKEIGQLLGRLADDLLLTNTVPRPPATDTPVTAGAVMPAANPADKAIAAAKSTPSLWIRLLEGAQRNMIGLGCRVNLNISAGPLSAELRECPK